MRLVDRMRYFGSSAVKAALGVGMRCPSCGGAGSMVDRKWLVTALRRCGGCGLLFRTPTTGAAESERFYQQAYEQGQTTELPGEDELQALVASEFSAMDGHYRTAGEILRRLGAGPRLFDYGCSWGYGSFQLRRDGFEVDSYEISRPRAAYAKQKLGANLVQPEEARPGDYDVFFSSHVIEHVPSVSAMLRLGLRLLKPGGLFVAFSPNGSEHYRRLQPANWHRCWGLVHPQLIDEVFLQRELAGKRFLVSSSPYHGLQWGLNDLTGDELLIVLQAD